MTARPLEQAVLAAGLGYLALLSWSMTNLSYDIWGAMVVVPIYGVIGGAIIRRLFRGHLHPVAVALGWGMVIKLAGAFARYWVGFEAYQGGIDAEAYHEFAVGPAGDVWSGDRSVFEALPSGTGTEFVERFTAFVYTVTGSSQLAGFVTFSFLAFIGVIFFVRAATIAVPGLAARRYAWLCALAPSLVYWPSSIGKDALMVFGLGVGTYGIALVLAHRGFVKSVPVIVFGVGFAAIIRPHIAGIWLAAILPGLVIAVISRSRATKGDRTAQTLRLTLALAIATIGFVFVASVTINFLAPGTVNEDGTTSDSITQIFEETSRRTAQAGSTFTPPAVSSPVSWPYASLRTLTRPLPIEARGLTQLFPAAEMVMLGGLYLISWRRLRNLPRLLFSNPYVAFAVATVLLGGLAYSSLANLAILARQKSLLFPLILLLPCLPTRAAADDGSASARDRRVPVSADTRN